MVVFVIPFNTFDISQHFMHIFFTAVHRSQFGQRLVRQRVSKRKQFDRTEINVRFCAFALFVFFRITTRPLLKLALSVFALRGYSTISSRTSRARSTCPDRKGKYAYAQLTENVCRGLDSVFNNNGGLSAQCSVYAHKIWSRRENTTPLHVRPRGRDF